MLQFVYSKSNLFKYIKDCFKKYELALWIKSNEFYIKRKGTFHSNQYYSRDIIWVDLGSNIGNELSYEHPCIVIKNDYEKVFVVPCSSSKLKNIYNKKGDLFPEYMLGDVTDGFTSQTTIILNNAKWISKSRILKKHNKQMSKVLFDKMYEKVFGMIFESRQYTITKLNERIKELEEQINKLKEDNEKLKVDNDKITNFQNNPE
jgi:mRNA-degrading endonuclease toxin of MazEF toxin-antitoxin module